MNARLRLLVILICAVVAGSCAPSARIAGDTSYGRDLGVRPDSCTPAWSFRTPRDSVNAFVAALGTAETREAALDTATDRAHLALLRTMYEVALSDRGYSQRINADSTSQSGSAEGWFRSHGRLSGVSREARSAICDIGGAYQVWVLDYISYELLLQRLQERDPLAKSIDFRAEIRERARRP